MKYFFCLLILISTFCASMDRFDSHSSTDSSIPLRRATDGFEQNEETIARLDRIERSYKRHRIAQYIVNGITLIGIGGILYVQYYSGEKIKEGAHNAIHDAKDDISSIEQNILDKVTTIAQDAVSNALETMQQHLSSQLSAISHSFNNSLQSSMRNMTTHISSQVNTSINHAIERLMFLCYKP